MNKETSSNTRLFLDRVVEILSEKEDANKNPEKLYLVNSFNVLSRLNDISNDLERCIIYMEHLYNPELYNKYSISPIDNLKYHTEVFIHKITTIREIMFQAVNQIYELELNEIECTSWKIISKRMQNKNMKILDIIDQYFNLFKTHIDLRNFNSHQSYDILGFNPILNIEFQLFYSGQLENLDEKTKDEVGVLQTKTVKWTKYYKKFADQKIKAFFEESSAYILNKTQE